MAAHLLKAKFLNGHFARFTESHVPQQHGGTKSQRVHVLGGCGKNLAALDKFGALRLSLSRCLLKKSSQTAGHGGVH